MPLSPPWDRLQVLPARARPYRSISAVLFQWLPLPPLHQDSLANTWTNYDRDTRGRVILGGDPRIPRSLYCSTPVFPHFVSLLSQRRTRRTKRTGRTRRKRRVIVSGARTLNLRRANTRRQQIHTRWGVMNVQDFLGRSGSNLPLFSGVPPGDRCGSVDVGSQGALR